MRVLAAVLGGLPKENRLFRALMYDRQLAAGVEASHPTHLLSGTFEVELYARPGEKLDEVVKLADAEIERALHKDPAIGYPAGQSLARQLRIDHTSNGIVYPSIRHIGGTCLVCFRPDLVQNLRQGGIWRLEWQGTPTPSVTRQG